MMKGLIPVFLSLLLAACAGPQPAPAPAVAVHNTVELAEVAAAATAFAQRYEAADVLVAFDLDNTLLAMETDLGADQWYEWQRALQAEDPCDPALVSDRLAVQGALYHVGAMQPTEGNIAELIAGLKRAGHPLMIVTARGSDFRLPTFRELRRNDIYIGDAAPGPYRGFRDTVILEGAERPVRYEDGVLMLAGQHKGRMLLALYRHLDLPLPEAVVFADDKEKNARAVAEALEQAGIPGRVFIYDGELPRVRSFDANDSIAQWAQISTALRTVEDVMGPVNFRLPESDRPDGCPR